MLFFRNEGDADYPNLKVVEAEQHADAADRDIKSGPAGQFANGPLEGGGTKRSGLPRSRRKSVSPPILQRL